MMRNILVSIAIILMVSFQAISQDKAITGKIIADDGSELPGVNISIKGTTQGSVSDVNGGYSIAAPTGSTLIFSFVGYETQEIKVGSQSVINITLKSDVGQLQEVVVTALGQQKNRNELVYAAQSVTAEEITQSRGGNVMNALSGKVAGVDIKTSNTMGGSTNVVIRGFKSITGNNQALWVIDGIPVSNANTNTTDQQTGRGGADYGNAASDINPDNIASVNILKGAAATVLYGSRASNGVILITTKQGKKNSFDITINSGVTWGKIDRSTYAKYQKEYGAGYDGDDLENGFYNDVNLGGGLGKAVKFDLDGSFGPKFDPSLNVYHWDSFDPTSPTYGKMTPWVAAKNGPDKFYETAVSSNQSVSIMGGGANSTFKVGYTRTDDKGVLPNSKLAKNLFNFSGSYDLSPKFSVSANANFAQVTGLGRFGTGYDGKNPNQQFRQWFQTNIDMVDLKNAYFRNHENVTWNWANHDGTFTKNYPIYSDNPYWSRYQNYSNDTRDNYFSYASANYKIANWVDAMARISYNGTNDFQEERIAIKSSDVSEYERYNRQFNETNMDLIFNFRKSITPDISFNGLLGSSIRRSKMNSIRASTNGGLVVANLYSLANTVNPITAPKEFHQRIGVDGIYAQASFNYKSLINLELSGRRDKSTTLPKDNNAYFYPSIGANFNFSEFPSLSNEWLSRGKFSVNYAEVGNDAPWGSILDIYDKPTGIGRIPFFSLPNTKNNLNLKSERTKNLEFSLETAFLHERLGFTFTYYKSNTLDQILPVSVSSATGFLYKYINSGEVQNKGIELSAFALPVETSNFSWRVGLNFSRNRNQVLSLYGDVENIPIATLPGGVSINAGFERNKTTGEVKGLPFGIIRGTNFVYHENGQKIVKSNGMYQASSSSGEIIGNPNPDWIGGLNNQLKFKSISLNFLIDVRKGGDIFSLDQWYGEGTGMYPITAGLNELGNPKRDPVTNDNKSGGVLFPGVQEDGSQNTIRASNVDANGATAYGYPSNPPRAMYIYDGSYVKLRELVLSYSIPTKIFRDRKYLKGIDISLIGRNLWIIHKNMEYSDPEENLGSGTSNGAGGYQGGAYPAVRSYGFNVKLKI